jgi:hypothetical protein
MHPFYSDFDPNFDYDDPTDEDQPETEVIAGIEIRGSEVEDDFDGEELPF